MAEVLRPTNFDSINIIEETELSADVAASQAVANVLNSQGFTVGEFYVVGKLAGERSEIVKLLSKTGNALTATTNFSNTHKKGEAVTRLFADKIRIYRAANVDGSIPDNDDFSVIATIDIEADQNYTEYTDSSGGSDYWYKKTFYNSVSTSETEISEAVAVRGGNYGYYVTWEEVRGEAGLDTNKWITASVYHDKLKKAQSEVNSSLRIGGYTLPLSTVPEVVKHAVILLAAGYVLTRDYGPENAGTSKDGERKIKQAKEILKRIEDGSESLTDDNTGSELPTNTPGRVAGYPDNSAAYNNPSEDRFFRTTDKF
jgi:hypothetical protein